MPDLKPTQIANIKEDFLQFVWQNRLYSQEPLKTTNGTKLEVLKPGELNTDSGADFFNARIKLGELVLAGNVEVHVKSSHWIRHHHQHDSAYDNIILHVVFVHDLEIPQNTANNVEVLELKSYIGKELLDTYSRFQREERALPCSFALNEVPSAISAAWLSRMAIERLETKMADVEKRFIQFNNDFLQTYFALLLRAFGFKTNSLPFELIAAYLPFHILMKHSSNRLQLEALLLGTAGMLEEEFADKYLRGLQNEYSFLKDKYKLSQLSKDIFKYSRLRPGNFPALRLAQLAHLLHNKPDLFMDMERVTAPEELKKQLQFELSDYWKHHYKPDGKLVSRDIRLGNTSLESLLINAFSYFYFFYGKKLGKPVFQDYALSILEHLSFEENHKTKKFSVLIGKKASALESQGIIHLYDQYCVHKKCLSCAIAACVFKNQV